MEFQQIKEDCKILWEILPQKLKVKFASAKEIFNKNETKMKLNCLAEVHEKNYDEITTMSLIEIKEIFPEIKSLKKYLSDKESIEEIYNENYISILNAIRLEIIVNHKKQVMNFAQKLIPFLENSNKHPRELDVVKEIIDQFNVSMCKDQIDLYKSELMTKITDRKLSNVLPNASDIYTELPYLYRLTKTDKTKHQFLFGTQHDLKLNLISPEAIQIIKNCDSLFIESCDENEESINDVIKSFIEKHPQQDLSQDIWMNSLADNQFKTLNNLCQEFNIKVKAMSHLPTNLVLKTLSYYLVFKQHLTSQENSKYCMDDEIEDYFSKNNKEIKGLENCQDRGNAFIGKIEDNAKKYNNDNDNENTFKIQRILEDISNVGNDTTESNAQWDNATDYLLSKKIILPDPMSRRNM